ncbi:c-type cytochrome [Pontibacter sp. JAM-7]|uniref:SorU family sulfite dehydrogenase c-type cytochrome subunit n=1 Tax=Pontibacter sp. JAM-7 TaxID=3366581 RepID=UPI003AF79A62
MRTCLLLASTAVVWTGQLAAGDAFQTGRALFTAVASPSCSICHTLKDADASGDIGPNLNELKPTVTQVINVVTSGSGVMPSFSESLTPAQIKAVAHYVATASRLE